MAFVRLEDADAGVECVFFGEPWARSSRVVTGAAAEREDADGRVIFEPLLVTGRVERRDDQVQLRAATAELLSEVRVRETREVALRLGLEELGGARLDQLVQQVSRSDGPVPLCLVVTSAGRFEAEVVVPGIRVMPGVDLERTMRETFGRDGVVSYR